MPDSAHLRTGDGIARFEYTRIPESQGIIVARMFSNSISGGNESIFRQM
jgi:hypothetical protein